jgi:hypothetical protein
MSIASSSRGITPVVVAAIAIALSACGGGSGTPSSAGATSALKLAAVGVTTSLTAVTACAALEGKSAGGATVVSAVLAFADGAYTSPGWPLSGNEDDATAWPLWLTGPGNGVGSLQFLVQDTTVKNYLARDPLAISLTYEWNSNPATLQSMALLNDATNTDLRPFVRDGGKLILWHGGNDAAVTIRATTAFHEGARKATGVGSFDRSVRYYTAPGVSHCFGGPGADQADLLSAIPAPHPERRGPPLALGPHRHAISSPRSSADRPPR